MPAHQHGFDSFSLNAGMRMPLRLNGASDTRDYQIIASMAKLGARTIILRECILIRHPKNTLPSTPHPPFCSRTIEPQEFSSADGRRSHSVTLALLSLVLLLLLRAWRGSARKTVVVVVHRVRLGACHHLYA